ncbi:ATP synthase subunit b', chloroplastic [Amborella trichopoda]|uniref:Uncharacterized protein n=1 Tax=Amborella trichopoda TaxID=13333 RepID=U5DFK1_AMBTC|nr:ATP synthase subunit b', chloroplastic [Amborella trichopoda]ERN20237.1 hypothetical protein AMTR_s00066p00151690 [Amborella trichopoda]|eukprot:XP_006858770.1 ATP synthase subunit b', chloroplastic [Amborella trichopoda]
MLAAPTSTGPGLIEMEKAIIFNFNLTLPIIAITGELLLLMNSVRDTSKEVKEEQAATVMNAVRAEISEALNQMKREVIVDLEVKMAGAKEGEDHKCH